MEKFVVIKNEWIKELNRNPKNLEINVKCGIHTGDLLFGIIDTEYRNQITVYAQLVTTTTKISMLRSYIRVVVIFTMFANTAYG
jgi:hypothetical protein